MINNEKIAILLIKKKKTKSQWAEYLGISKSTLARKLNGTRISIEKKLLKVVSSLEKKICPNIFLIKKLRKRNKDRKEGTYE